MPINNKTCLCIILFKRVSYFLNSLNEVTSQVKLDQVNNHPQSSLTPIEEVSATS